MVPSHAGSKGTLHLPVQTSGFEVLDAFHRCVLARVAELGALVAAIEGGEITPAIRASAAEIARSLGTDARCHHEDEERHIFPPLLTGGEVEVVQAVLRLQQDHGWLEQDWFELEPHVRAIATGYGTFDIDTLREGVSLLAELYQDHIALEESLVYPAARERMDAATLDRMAPEMVSRRRIERAKRRIGASVDTGSR